MSEQEGSNRKRFALIVLGLLVAGLCIPLLLSAKGKGSENGQGGEGQPQPHVVTGNDPAQQSTTPESVPPTTQGTEVSPDPQPATTETDVPPPVTTTTPDQQASTAQPTALETQDPQPTTATSRLQSLPVKLLLVSLVLAALCAAAYIAYTMYQEDMANQQRLLEEAEAKAAEEALEMQRRRQIDEAAKMTEEEAKALREFTLQGSQVFAGLAVLILFSVLALTAVITGHAIAAKWPFSLLPGTTILTKCLLPVAVILSSLVGCWLASNYYPPLAPFGCFGGVAIFLLYFNFAHRDVIAANVTNKLLRFFGLPLLAGVFVAVQFATLGMFNVPDLGRLLGV